MQQMLNKGKVINLFVRSKYTLLNVLIAMQQFMFYSEKISLWWDKAKKISAACLQSLGLMWATWIKQ